MYGQAESVIGDLTSELHLREKLFLATKVWTSGKEAGVESMERSFERLRVKRLDLMQVHNLVDVDTQLATMRAWKEEGRIRISRVTHYVDSAFPEDGEEYCGARSSTFSRSITRLSIARRTDRLLPLAREHGWQRS